MNTAQLFRNLVKIFELFQSRLLSCIFLVIFVCRFIHLAYQCIHRVSLIIPEHLRALPSLARLYRSLCKYTASYTLTTSRLSLDLGSLLGSFSLLFLFFLLHALVTCFHLAKFDLELINTQIFAIYRVSICMVIFFAF